MTTARAGIALGSNLGDRHAHLQAAVARLRQIAVPGAPVLTAPIYQTEPRDCPPGSPDFYNTVVEIEFAGTARELLDATQAIEAELGRVRHAGRNAPRLIDLDLLYHGDTCVSDGTPVLPNTVSLAGGQASGLAWPTGLRPGGSFADRRDALSALTGWKPVLLSRSSKRTVLLVLPHPRLGERRFVLQPLADIRPELVLPGQQLTVAEMLARLPADDAPLVPTTAPS